MIKLGLIFERTYARSPAENSIVDIFLNYFECSIFNALKFNDTEYVKKFIEENDIILIHLFLFRFASKSKKIGDYPHYSLNYNQMIENAEHIINSFSSISKPVCCFLPRSDWYNETEEFWKIIPKHFYIFGGIQKGFINTTPEEDIFFDKVPINLMLGNHYFPDDRIFPLRHCILNSDLKKYTRFIKSYDFSVLGVMYKRRKDVYAQVKKSSFKVFNPSFLLRLRKILNSLNKKFAFTNRILNIFFNIAIAKSKASYADGSTLNMFIRKYLEIPACKTLLMCYPLERMEDYGFEEGVHYIACTSENILEKLNFVVKNDSKRFKIIENAYQLLERRYTETYLAPKLVDLFTALKNSTFRRAYYYKGDLIIEKINHEQ